MKWLFRPMAASLREYCLIRNIWAGDYPQYNEDQLPLSTLERAFMTLLVVIRSLSFVHLCRLATNYRVASFLSEFYVILRLTILCVVLFAHAHIPNWISYTIITYCLIDGLNYRLCIIFVDRYGKNWGLRSLNRSLILLMLNYSEIVIGFAGLFLNIGSICNSQGDPITLKSDALYFSVVTITTLGYGDYYPSDTLGRWLCCAETIMGFVLIVLVIGIFLTGVKNIHNVPAKQEQEDN
jgi:hypothetical protein